MTDPVKRGASEAEETDGGAVADCGHDHDHHDHHHHAHGECDAPVTVRREAPKIGRNDPCPCGSGRKHKKCCGG